VVKWDTGNQIFHSGTHSLAKIQPVLTSHLPLTQDW
jgi:hypothetical protein